MRGARGLRLVDASVFPKISGYLFVTAIYIIAEKARDASYKMPWRRSIKRFAKGVYSGAHSAL
jgi:choline dehydrogenase-like flavoprotein